MFHLKAADNQLECNEMSSTEVNSYPNKQEDCCSSIWGEQSLSDHE
ncbi:hypothetical protein RSSM_05546 [Rhodopirellula sallentina SM41]|uniref:Uncharacterized protein n=1 Tax=Rhodopirellula sallentina SM41 TaxID=1263870 RepID=M5TUZ7_9BACT|nr:hypothetical protein RSSM_05546 [Rhodopirellula sallentina SM41]